MTEPTAPEAPPSAYDEQISPLEQQFERWRKVAGIFLAPAAFAVTYVLCTGLTPQGRTLAAILAGVGMMWMCEVIPLPVTALLGAMLCVLLGVADAKTVLSSFGDPIIFVFLGSFMIARAMSVHRLDRRIALYFLSIPMIGSSPAGMLAGLGIVTAFLSMWVSNTATTAMMVPIGIGMLTAIHRLRVQRGEATGEMNARAWPFATAMMLMVAYAASIGGIGTPVGSPPNLITIGLIRDTTQIDITFFQWMLLSVPLLLVMGVVLFALLYFMHRDPARRRSAVSGADVLAYIHGARRELGPWTRGQVNTLIAFGVAVTLWVLPGVLALPWLQKVDWAMKLDAWFDARLPESIVAVSAAILLFILPTNLREGEFTLTWHEGQKIDWGTILLFGGGLALGTLMFKTGVAAAMGKSLTGQIGATSLWALTAVSILLGIILSEATSNTAATTMVIPVIIAISKAAGVDPLPPALGGCLGASYGFMLPVSTPPNAIAYGSGLVPLARMMRAGIIFDIIGFGIIFVGLRLMYPYLSFGS
jgi:sodium-dependent dicarboxylate transporter 2/3/5